ncbi:hypothetical protein [Streptomyces sp. NBC_00582]|uniref:hypothetical protein n=1 Tax=Streptomyces sp. NBC_00582 TaxID=2975783 RepID=UPI002E7FD9A2|nr:hypothetical protein [Streptomyces sp. NBC_00582]WUB64417.1 hypothetical protein OG852_30515 [Streptomyces sp. NBC_00582]
MIIVYTPKDGAPEHYDATTLKVSEAAIVQRTVDMKWQEILGGLENDDLEAMRGIVWVLKKRSQPSMRFGDFDPGVTEMTARLSTLEVEAYINNAFEAPATNPDISHDMVAEILRGRLPQLAADPDHALEMLEARAARGPKAEPTGAAPEQEESLPAEPSSLSPTSSEPEPSTSGSSPTSSTSLLPSSTTSLSATSTP